MNDLALTSENPPFLRATQPELDVDKVSDTCSPSTMSSNDQILDSVWQSPLAPSSESLMSMLSKLDEGNRKQHISNYDDVEGIIHGLKTLGLDEVSERLDDLNDICNDEAPDMLPINIDSLRSFALFMVESCRFLPIPEFGVGYEGDLQALWEFGEENSVVMDFLAEGGIGLLAVSFNPRSPKIEQVLVNDTLPDFLVPMAMKRIMAEFFSS